MSVRRYSLLVFLLWALMIAFARYVHA